MQKKYNFITGLPRSGTTLLTAILNQNPRFTASISGPLARFARSVIQESSSQGGYRLQCDETMRKRIIRGIFDSYYADSSEEVVFDTNRGWSLLSPLVKDLYPSSKIIVCVRSVSWILDSFETLVRKNPYAFTSMYSTDENTNVYSRCTALMRSDRPVGFAYEGLKQLLSSREMATGSVFILEYDRLAKRPESTMEALYKFLEEPHFEHDFNNVETSYDEFDADVNLKGLHTTRSKVEFIERQFILPPDIVQQYANSEIWRGR